MGASGALERFQLSVRELESIAANEAAKPGRKLLIWVGPGWPLLTSMHFATPREEDRRRYFRAIIDVANRLLEARMVVNSVTAYDPVGSVSNVPATLYQNYLNAVVDEKQAAAGNLSLRVLATRTGGRILGPGNDLVAQINQCIADANAFYSITFTAPAARVPDEYHGFSIQVARGSASVRSDAGYYAEPPDRQP